MVFMFWNIFGNKSESNGIKVLSREQKILSLLKDISDERKINFIMLAENKINNNEIISYLNNRNKGGFYSNLTINNHIISVFSNYDYNSIKYIYNSSRFVIYKISILNLYEILLVILHMPSKLRADSDDITRYSLKIKGTINEIKTRYKIERVIIVGDFNMNPFEKPMIAADNFHAVMDRSYVLRNRERKINEDQYEMYYNPMWNFLGDKNIPFGTYFYNSGKHINYLWNMFDQVILNEKMLDLFDVNKVEIITRISNTNLLNKSNYPDKNISDHLPIIFELNIKH